MAGKNIVHEAGEVVSGKTFQVLKVVMVSSVHKIQSAIVSMKRRLP